MNQTFTPVFGNAVNVAAERNRTRGVKNSRHFNAAGSALPSAAVVARVVEHLRLEEAIGGYEAAAQVKSELDNLYELAARVIGSQADEIALFDSASTGLRAVIDALRLKPGSRIIASRSTYVSHALHLMTYARENDIDLVVAPVGSDRRVDLEALNCMLADGRPTVLSIGHVPTSSGFVEPAEEIGAIAAAHGSTYILDATQSVGQLEIDVSKINCDVLVTTGRKYLRAPRGTGFTYVRRALLEQTQPTAPDVRGTVWTTENDWEVFPNARRFETWEASIAGRLGLGTAMEELLERGVSTTVEWLCQNAESIRDALRAIPGVTITDPEGDCAAFVTFVVEGFASRDVVVQLAERNVSVVSVPASHGQWDLGDRHIDAVVRASPHVYNDEGDVSALIEGVADLARKAKK